MDHGWVLKLTKTRTQMASTIPFPPIIVKILDRDERQSVRTSRGKSGEFIPAALVFETCHVFTTNALSNFRWCWERSWHLETWPFGGMEDYGIFLKFQLSAIFLPFSCHFPAIDAIHGRFHGRFQEGLGRWCRWNLWGGGPSGHQAFSRQAGIIRDQVIGKICDSPPLFLAHTLWWTNIAMENHHF